MKKKIFALMIGMLLIGVNLYAQGDLQVNGELVVGTTSDGTSKVKAIASGGLNAGFFKSTIDSGSTGAVGLTLTGQVAGTSTGWSTGILLTTDVSSSAATVGGASGADFTVALAGATAVSSTISDTRLGYFKTIMNPGDTNYNVTQGYGVDLNLIDNRFSGSALYSFDDYKNVNINDANNAYGALSVDNLAGIWIKKQTLGGTSNYGLVLDGDVVPNPPTQETDFGAAIVLGDTQNVKLYARAGDLYVLDAAANETPLGPHDFETGEWIFYSKNLKTGRVVRVNMEKLVKAVEELTGEKFMVETVEDTK
jgi:hypothetical protein